MPNELAPVPNAPGQAAPAPLQLPSPFADVYAGKLPAIQIPPIHNRVTDDVQEFTVQNFPTLCDVLDYWEDQKSGISVFYNPKLISEAKIEKLHAEGKLHEVAPVARKLGAPGVAVQPDGQPGMLAQANAGGSPAGSAAPAASLAPPAQASAVSGPLAGARVPANSGIHGQRLENMKFPPGWTPNPTIATMQKRPV